MSTPTSPDPDTRQSRSGDPRPMTAAKTPVASGAIATLGLLLALLLTVAGVVAVRDALVYAGVVEGTPVLSHAARAVNGVTPAAWLVPVAVVLALLGLWLLVTALRPRPRKAVALSAQTGVFLRPGDVSRLAETAAEQVDGVLDVSVSAKTRSATATVRTTGDDGIVEHVREAVTQRLAPLENPPALKIRSTGGTS